MSGKNMRAEAVVSKNTRLLIFIYSVYNIIKNTLVFGQKSPEGVFDNII
jgi:hypothetical protein